jgi:hypothetical protein
MMLTGLTQLDREIRVAKLVFDAANYDHSTTLTSGAHTQFDDPASDALGILTDALDVPLVRPNSLVIGQQAWTKLRRNKTLVQAIGHSAQLSGYVLRLQIAELLEIKNIYVGESRFNTAKKGAAPNFARAWGKHCALLNINGMAAQMGQPTFGFTAAWGSRIAGEIAEPKKGLRGGTLVRSGESVLEVISSKDAGYFFENCVG